MVFFNACLVWAKQQGFKCRGNSKGFLKASGKGDKCTFSISVDFLMGKIKRVVVRRTIIRIRNADLAYDHLTNSFTEVKSMKQFKALMEPFLKEYQESLECIKRWNDYIAGTFDWLIDYLKSQGISWEVSGNDIKCWTDTRDSVVVFKSPVHPDMFNLHIFLDAADKLPNLENVRESLGSRLSVHGDYAICRELDQRTVCDVVQGLLKDCQ